jgi:hypothetical protein
MRDRWSEAEDDIRVRLERIRRDRNLSYRAQAAAMGVRFQWLQGFIAGYRRISDPTKDAAKRAMGTAYPELLPALIRLSLLWSEDGAAPPTPPAETANSPPPAPPKTV